MLDKLLLDVLVDPTDRGELCYFASRDLLFNPRSNVAYEVKEGIAVLLPTEARLVEGAELAELTAELGSSVRTGAGRD